MAIPAGPDLAADDGPVIIIQTDTTALNLTSGTWYTAKVVVESQTSWPYANVLTIWVDTDGDADFSDETALLGQFVTGAVGYVGVYRGAEGSTVQQFDDFKLGTDNSSPKDGDFADAGDEIAIDDNFNSTAISLTYDNNGNLTDDGIFAFVYDAWNRLVKAKHRSASNAATIGTYAYDGIHLRSSQEITNSGQESTLGDGGNRTTHCFSTLVYSAAEERNGSNQVVRVFVSDARDQRELIWIEINGDITVGADSNPDSTAAGEGSEVPPDTRYFCHSSRNGYLSLSKYDISGSTNGIIVERHLVTPLKTTSCTSELATEELASVAIGSSILSDVPRFPPGHSPRTGGRPSAGGIPPLPLGPCYAYMVDISFTGFSDIEKERLAPFGCDGYDGLIQLAQGLAQSFFADRFPRYYVRDCPPNYCCFPTHTIDITVPYNPRLCIFVGPFLQWGWNKFEGASCKICLTINFKLSINGSLGICIPSFIGCPDM